MPTAKGLKTVAVSPEVHADLVKATVGKESFSDTISRLIEESKRYRDLVELYEDRDHYTLAALGEAFKKTMKEVRQR